MAGQGPSSDVPSVFDDDDFSGRGAVRIASVAALGGFLFGYDSAVINGAVSSIQGYFGINNASLGFAVASALLGAAADVVCLREFAVLDLHPKPGEPPHAAVDRLLASPAFGERWARWWLDLARYADSKGVVLIGATGNEFASQVGYPAALDEDGEGDRRMLCRGESDEPCLVGQTGALGPARNLGRTGLPRDADSGQRCRRTGALVDHRGHRARQLRCRLGIDNPRLALGLHPLDQPPVPIADRGPDPRLHQDAAIGDRRRHLSHLQRGHQQPLLADRDPADVDPVIGTNGAPVLEHPGNREFVSWQIDLGLGTEPEPIHIFEERFAPDPFPESGEEGIGRVGQGRLDVDRAESGTTEVGEGIALDVDRRRRVDQGAPRLRR